MFTRTVEFFAELAERQPAVLLLEDLHWADPASVDFLRYFARSVPAHRLLLVATHRRDELNRQHPLAINLPLLVREAGAERIEVRRLNDAATRTLIQGRYTLAGDDQQRLERYLEARAEGNPLFAGELLRTLEEHDILQPEGGRWQLGELADVSVPPLLKQVIEGRLARLGDEIPLYLAQASVIGQDVPLNLWSTVTGLPETALLEVMEHAIDARLLDPTDRGARFVHALIRDAIYDSVLPVRRRVWHRQIGEALLDRPNPDADQLAHHFQQAGDDRATEWLIQAGERAERSFAWLTAANRFEAAANLMANDPSASQERTILLNRVAMWRRYADPALALAMLEEVLRLAKAADDRALMAYDLFDVGMLRCFVGDLREGISEMESGIAALSALAPSERARLDDLTDVADQRGTLALWLARAGRFEDALAQGTRVLHESTAPASSETGGGSTYGDACTGIAYALATLGRPDEANGAFDRAIQTYRTVEHHAHVLWQSGAVLNMLVLPYRTDDLPKRQRLSRQIQEAARRASGTLIGVPLRIELMPLLVVEGHWAEAYELAAMQRSVPSAISVGPGVLLVIGSIARAQGDTDLAWSMVRDQIPDGAATTPGSTLCFETLDALRLAAALTLDANDLSAAREWLEAHDRWLAWSGAVLGRAEGVLLWARYDAPERSFS